MNEDDLKEWFKSRDTQKKIEAFGSRGVVCSRTKLKPGSLEGVRNWFQTLQERQDELLAFTEEGVSLESVFIEKSGEDFFLIFYMRSDDFRKTYEAIQKALLPITVYHFNCWQTYCETDSEMLELVFDLKRE